MGGPPVAGSLWARLRLLRCAAVGRAPAVEGRVWIHGPGRVVLGSRVRLDASGAPIELHAGPGAEIVIGDDVAIAGGASIEAAASVTIGDRCRIDAFAKILDNHFHPLRGDRRVRPASAPVVLEPDVRVGQDAIVLPGARVRQGCAVPAGAVVRGAPARTPAQPDPGTGREQAGAPAGVMEAAAALLAVLRARWLFRSCERGARIYASGNVRVHNEGRLIIGDRAAFLGGMIPTELVSRRGGILEIGARSVLNYGASIEAHESVRIGSRCMLASRVRICDRGPGGNAPITIGDDVWIAHGATIQPGVTVGSGSVVSAGSVVCREIPPLSLAVGNPARCIRLELAAGASPRVGSLACRAPPSGGALPARPPAKATRPAPRAMMPR